jgi:hypothetical protein
MGALHPSETPEAPWDTISVDFIVELPESHGYDAIMCVVDSLTKRAHFIPMHTTINAEGTALLFHKEVWKHHGTPRVVVSDRGPQFIAADMTPAASPRVSEGPQKHVIAFQSKHIYFEHKPSISKHRRHIEDIDSKI